MRRRQRSKRKSTLKQSNNLQEVSSGTLNNVIPVQEKETSVNITEIWNKSIFQNSL